MSQDTLVQADTLKVLGKMTSDNGNFSTDGTLGNLTATKLTVAGKVFGAVTSLDITSSAQAISADASTITTAKTINRTLPGAAHTGMILAAGTVDGQLCIVTNEAVGATSTLTFNATVATSNVAGDGTEVTIIEDNSATLFIWLANAAAPAWYPVMSVGVTN